MKIPKTLWLIGLIAALNSVALQSPALGVNYLSNLNGTQWSGYGVNADWGIGQSFRTGNSAGGYALNSVSLMMYAFYGNPSSFNVSIYSHSGNQPGVRLETFSGNNDPRFTGRYDYTSSGLTLAPATTYWIVARASGGSNNTGAYFWESTTDVTFQGSDGWQILYGNTRGNYGVNGNYWGIYDTGVYGTQKIAISATPVPEPGLPALLGLALAGLGWQRRGRGRTVAN